MAAPEEECGAPAVGLHPQHQEAWLRGEQGGGPGGHLGGEGVRGAYLRQAVPSPTPRCHQGGSQLHGSLRGVAVVHLVEGMGDSLATCSSLVMEVSGL